MLLATAGLEVGIVLVEGVTVQPAYGGERTTHGAVSLAPAVALIPGHVIIGFTAVQIIADHGSQYGTKNHLTREFEQPRFQLTGAGEFHDCVITAIQNGTGKLTSPVIITPGRGKEGGQGRIV